jgi:hypothetical protein
MHTLLAVIMLSAMLVDARKLMRQSSGDLETVESYTCIGSGVLQYPCVVNPAYTFAVGSITNSSSLEDR